MKTKCKLRALAPAIAAGLFISLLAAAPSAAQSPLGFLFSPVLGRMPYVVNYETRYLPQENVTGQSAELGWMEHQLSAIVPLWQNTDNELALVPRVEYLRLEGDAVLPDTGRSLPDDFWDLSLGATFRRRLHRDWIAGGMASLGAAADEPFEADVTKSVFALAFTRWQWRPTLAWNFMLFYTNRLDFAKYYPLPGAGLSYTPGPDLAIDLGLPSTSIRWRPWDRLTVSAMYFIPRIAKLRLGWQAFKPLEIFAAFHMGYQSFQIADRPDHDDWLYLYEKRGVAGIRWELDPKLTLEFSGGLAFDRYLFQGEDWGDRDQDRLDLDNAAEVTLKLVLRI